MAQPRKLFTVARANKALPLVARIVDDVVRTFAEIRRLDAERASARHENLETIERKLFDLEGELERHVQELTTIGCELKDPRTGLLDFLAVNGKQELYLCWMKGERAVEFWHPIETGFAGRRPVSELPKATLGD